MDLPPKKIWRDLPPPWEMPFGGPPDRGAPQGSRAAEPTHGGRRREADGAGRAGRYPAGSRANRDHRAVPESDRPDLPTGDGEARRAPRPPQSITRRRSRSSGTRADSGRRHSASRPRLASAASRPCRSPPAGLRGGRWVSAADGRGRAGKAGSIGEDSYPEESQRGQDCQTGGTDPAGFPGFREGRSTSRRPQRSPRGPP